MSPFVALPAFLVRFSTGCSAYVCTAVARIRKTWTLTTSGAAASVTQHDDQKAGRASALD